MNIQILVLEHGKDLPIPSYATIGSAGADLYAAIDENVLISPQEVCLIPCGFCMCIPSGYEGQIRSRSGLSLKHGIIVLNSPGTIDSDYRGEIKLIIMNTSKVSFTIEKGMRLAQLIISDVQQVKFEPVTALPESTRLNGFGSTGVK